MVCISLDETLMDPIVSNQFNGRSIEATPKEIFCKPNRALIKSLNEYLSDNL